MEQVDRALSEFCCALDDDIKEFLRLKALEFLRRKRLIYQERKFLMMLLKLLNRRMN